MSIHHELDRDSGAPGATWHLATAWRALGHEADILSHSDMKGPRGTRRYRFPFFVAAELCRRPAYDVLDLSSGDGWVVSVLRRLVARLRAPLLVARSHGLEHVQHESFLAQAKLGGLRPSWKYPVYNGGIHLWECRKSFTGADLALFLNPYDLGYAVSRLGVQPARAALVRNGIAAELLARRAHLPPSSGVVPRNVAFIGTYLPRKGIDTLRKAMIAALHGMPQMRLGLFGTGLEAAAVLAEYPQALHDRITVVPHYANAELFDLLADFHILAFPSLSEGYPLAVGEAMACGLVPVVSAVPGPADIVLDQVNGLVVPPADPAALQAALARLIQEPELWRRLRDVAIADAGRADWRRIAEETLALFSRHASSGSAAGPPGVARPANPPVTLDLPASVCDRIAHLQAAPARRAPDAIA